MVIHVTVVMHQLLVIINVVWLVVLMWLVTGKMRALPVEQMEPATVIASV